MRIPITWIWVATANNIRVSQDIARRCVRIRLVPQQEQPWARGKDEFKHPTLRAWSLEHRAELIEASLILIQAWVAAGLAAQAGVSPQER